MDDDGVDRDYSRDHEDMIYACTMRTVAPLEKLPRSRACATVGKKAQKKTTRSRK